MGKRGINWPRREQKCVNEQEFYAIVKTGENEYFCETDEHAQFFIYDNVDVSELEKYAKEITRERQKNPGSWKWQNFKICLYMSAYRHIKKIPDEQKAEALHNYLKKVLLEKEAMIDSQD